MPTTFDLDPARRATIEPTILLMRASETGPTTISPCTISMDHDAIICFMID